MSLYFAFYMMIATGGATSLCPAVSSETVNLVTSWLQHNEDFRADINASEQEFQSVEPVSDASTCDIIVLMAQSQGMGISFPDPRYEYVYLKSQSYYYLVGTYSPLPTDDYLDLGLLPMVVMTKEFLIINSVLH